MDTPDCEYCTARAIGIDEDGAFTCGVCMPSVGPLPSHIEVSDDDSEEEEG